MATKTYSERSLNIKKATTQIRIVAFLLNSLLIEQFPLLQSHFHRLNVNVTRRPSGCPTFSK